MQPIALEATREARERKENLKIEEERIKEEQEDKE